MSVALDELLMLPDEDVSAETLARLLAFAQDKDAEVRSLTAESLVRFAPDTDAADALIVLAQDADALVRTQALDSLAAFPTEKVLACLTAALAREAVDGLLYRYALLAAAEVAAALRQRSGCCRFCGCRRTALSWQRASAHGTVFRCAVKHRRLTRCSARLPPRIITTAALPLICWTRSACTRRGSCALCANACNVRLCPPFARQ